MITRFVQIPILIQNKKEQEQLFNFLKSFEGVVDFNNIIALPIEEIK